jgi:hypothetical protein
MVDVDTTLGMPRPSASRRMLHGVFGRGLPLLSLASW